MSLISGLMRQPLGRTRSSATRAARDGSGAAPAGRSCRGWHDPLAEQVLPEPVDHHPRQQGARGRIRLGQPARQAPAAVRWCRRKAGADGHDASGSDRQSDSQEPGLDFLAGTLLIAALKQVTCGGGGPTS